MSAAVGPSSSPLVSASFKDAFFRRPFAFFSSHEAKTAPSLTVPESPKHAYSETSDDSEDSVDAAQAAELLYSAQDDIISHVRESLWG